MGSGRGFGALAGWIPRPFRRFWLVSFATTMAVAMPSHGRTPSHWGLGVFPVVRFAGYTSPFGSRVHPIHGGVRPHHGLDIAAPIGSPVRSWWGGRVSEVIRDGGCGNGLVITSGPYEHLYCHLAGDARGGIYRSGSVILRRGQPVRAGQVIGHVGMSGSTTGPHLHWGLRHQGRWLDPALVLRAMAASRRRRSPNFYRMTNVGANR